MTDTNMVDDDAAFLGKYSEMMGAGYRDVYRDVYSEKRRETPVWNGDLCFAGMAAVAGVDESQIYTLFRYDDCDAALRDPRFSSTAYENFTGLVCGRMLLCMDGQEHREHRGLVAHAFRQSALARWESELVERVVHEVIDEIATLGSVNFLPSAFKIPALVIARILGLPGDDHRMFQTRTMELCGVGVDMGRGLMASVALREYFADIVAARRANPQDDLITDLVQADYEGATLEDESIYSALRFLLLAGVETTFRSIGNMLMLLLTHPEQLDAVRSDRSLVGAVLDEQLRLEPPVANIVRSLTVDTELRGVTLPADGWAVLCLGAANHDEARWERPDEFDIFREYKPSLAFAIGPHTCLGIHLARLELRVTLNALLDRLPNLRLDPGPDAAIQGLFLRSPNMVPMIFDPS